MSSEDTRKVVDFLLSKVPRWHCVVCGAGAWSVGEVVMLPLVKSLGQGLAGYSAVTVHCAECNHISFFDARNVGLNH